MHPTGNSRPQYRFDEVDPSQGRGQQHDPTPNFALPESHDVPFVTEFAQQDVYSPPDRLSRPDVQLAGQLQSLNPPHQHSASRQTQPTSQPVFLRHQNTPHAAQYEESVRSTHQVMQAGTVSQLQHHRDQQYQQQQYQQQYQQQSHQNQQHQSHQEQRQNQQLQSQNPFPAQSLFVGHHQAHTVQQTPRQQHPHQHHSGQITGQPKSFPIQQSSERTPLPPLPVANTWLQHWQQYRPSPFIIAQQYVDFWAVLRLSALARNWTFPALGHGPSPPPQTQLSRGTVSMYICGKAHCATPMSRTVLHRSAGILVPVQVADGVVVGHFFENVWIPDGGSHRESHLQGKYILCTRTREVLKIMTQPDDTAVAQPLFIDRSVMISEGVFLRDFVVVSIPSKHAPGTVPEQFGVSMRTTVMHTGEQGAGASNDGASASQGHKAPFISLAMNAQAAAEVAIDPSHGFHGFGIYNMTLTPSCAGIDVNSGPALSRALGMSWTPPIHISNCSQPQWSMQQLKRSEAEELRRLFNASYARKQALVASRLRRNMNLPFATSALAQSHIMSNRNMPASSSGQALKIGSGVVMGMDQSGGKSRSESDSQLHNQIPSPGPHQLFHMPMQSQLAFSTGQRSMPSPPSLGPSSSMYPHTQIAAVRPITGQAASLAPRITPQAALSPTSFGSARHIGGMEPLSRPLNVRPIYSDFPKTSAPISTSASTVKRGRGKTKSSWKSRRKIDALPAPTHKEVIMRNRISAQRSNEKRRIKLDRLKLEAAYLRDTLIPRLEMTKALLENENRKLIAKFTESFGMQPITSFHSRPTSAGG